VVVGVEAAHPERCPLRDGVELEISPALTADKVPGDPLHLLVLLLGHLILLDFHGYLLCLSFP